MRYDPEQEPPPEDIDHFVAGALARGRLLPLQASRYVLRETYQTLSWLKAYIHCEADDLRRNFVRADKSFYIALLEHADTGDRSVSFRLTTAGLKGHTEWRVSIRSIWVEGKDGYFLCAE
jgi:hypothetical protein